MIFISDQVILKIDLKRKTAILVPEVLVSINSGKDILRHFLIILITGKM